MQNAPGAFRISSEAAELLLCLLDKFGEFIVLYILKYRKLVISKRSKKIGKSKVIYFSFLMQLRPLR